MIRGRVVSGWRLRTNPLLQSLERPYALKMTAKPERRNKIDRREKPRGGRRPYDVAGSAPLVLVVGNTQEREAECGTILSRLQFAVAPANDVADALRVIDAVRPDVIVAGPESAEHLRSDRTIALPVVEFDPAREDGDALVERIRRAVRTRRKTAP